MADNDKERAKPNRKQPVAASPDTAKPEKAAKTRARISAEHKKAWARLDGNGKSKP